jgi:hypothetical protein
MQASSASPRAWQKASAATDHYGAIAGSHKRHAGGGSVSRGEPQAYQRRDRP